MPSIAWITLERFTLATSLPLAYRQLSLCKTAILPFLDSFSWSLRDFCQDGKNTKSQASVCVTALAGPAGIFARMVKTQKRRERFTLATSLPLAYRQLSYANRLSCRFHATSFSWSRRDFCQDGRKTQKRWERFTLATSLPLAYRQLSCAKRLVLPFFGQL